MTESKHIPQVHQKIHDNFTCGPKASIGMKARTVYIVTNSSTVAVTKQV